ncbi:Fur family transcriptional regulator [Microbacterium sp. ASV49]|uniref:Fur family transcriptional regulator n=1 Tax=Microbacterium candidum TaxID=3041922 RepID=A0ABT7MTE9_9MICO|nr:Fur family transcriptional regulator [Microbacterium sp. ASV49]MDL9977730.1 Fur family transcriptional regulator [Microbacterium sp. ASV49]
MSTTLDHRQLHLRSAAQAVQDGLAALRDRGERVTPARRLVVELLAESPEHLTADAVAGRLADAGVHRATVYRTLDLLVEYGIAAMRRTAGGAVRYHLATTSTAHGHLHGHCRRCDSVVILPADAFSDAIAQLRDRTGFEFQPDYAALEGICADCRR